MIMFLVFEEQRKLKAGGNVLVSGFLGAPVSCGVPEGFPRREACV